MWHIISTSLKFYYNHKIKKKINIKIYKKIWGIKLEILNYSIIPKLKRKKSQIKEHKNISFNFLVD